MSASSLTVAEYRQARQARDDAARELVAAKAALTSIERRQTDLMRIKRCRPKLAALDQALGVLQSLGKQRLLPDGASETLDAVQQQLHSLAGAIEAAKERRDAVAKELEAFPVAGKILEHAATIKDLQDQRHTRVKAITDLPKRKTEEAESKHLAAQAARDLGVAQEAVEAFLETSRRRRLFSTWSTAVRCWRVPIKTSSGWRSVCVRPRRRSMALATWRRLTPKGCRPLSRTRCCAPRTRHARQEIDELEVDAKEALQRGKGLAKALPGTFESIEAIMQLDVPSMASHGAAREELNELESRRAAARDAFEIAREKFDTLVAQHSAMTEAGNVVGSSRCRPPVNSVTRRGFK